MRKRGVNAVQFVELAELFFGEAKLLYRRLDPPRDIRKRWQKKAKENNLEAVTWNGPGEPLRKLHKLLWYPD